jgi:hypothetical protein
VETPTFIEYFRDQGFFEVLAVTAVLAGGFLFALAAAAVIARRLRYDGVQPFLAASAIALGLYVVGFTLFEAAALYLRTNPHGGGIQKQGAERDQFVALAKTGFALLYFGVVLAAAAVGYLLARRRKSARPGLVAVASLAGIALFLLLTLPFADFENACNVGEPFVLDSSC